MTVEMLVKQEFVNDDTELILRGAEHKILARGNCLTDLVRSYYEKEISGFLWADNNRILADLVM